MVHSTALYEVNWKDGLIEVQIYGSGKTNKFTKDVDLKAFYGALRQMLLTNRIMPFQDRLGLKEDQKYGNFFNYGRKAGEQQDTKGNRNREPGLFETKFTKEMKGENLFELEISWKAWCPTRFSPYGWIELDFNLENRFASEKEILLEGDKKMKVITGTWEFRSEMHYKNAVIHKYLNNVPFVKNSPYLKDMYITHVYDKTLENDIMIFGFGKMVPLFDGFIKEWFGEGLEGHK